VNHHDVDRITVIGLGRWHEAPIVRIGQSGEERFGERECFDLGVIREFGAAATRRFDDNKYVAIIL
jgi:hypothetical protein